MILDNEDQRKNLLSVIKEVTVQGTMEEAIQIINMLKGLEHDIQSATLHVANVVPDTDEKVGSIHAI